MVNENVEELYTEIAYNINESIKDSWSQAIINFEYFGDAAEYSGRYISIEKNSQSQFKVGYKIYKAFKKLHHLTTENQMNNWNRAKYTLYSDGNFDIEFEWDQGLADEIERLSKED